MLIDDNFNDNFFHERAIKKVNNGITVIAKTSGSDALEYLSSQYNKEDQAPDLIFLDINMPRMNGWDFLEKYLLLAEEAREVPPVIMLSTSENPHDIERMKSFNIISDYYSKPLTKEKMEDIQEKHFQ